MVCTTPVTVNHLCQPCGSHYKAWGARLANRVGFMTYAVGGTKSGALLRGYKGAEPSPADIDVMRTFCLLGLTEHNGCLARITGVSPSRWAVVPSLGGRAGDHPLRAVMRGVLTPSHEVELMPGSHIHDPRAATPENFAVIGAVPVNSHVVVVDDTWTSGGHAQSAAMALRVAGAGLVSVFCVARWLRPEWSDNAPFISTRLMSPYTIHCPWTSGGCP